MQASESQGDITGLAFALLERSVRQSGACCLTLAHLGSAVGHLLVLMIKNSSEADC